MKKHLTKCPETVDHYNETGYRLYKNSKYVMNLSDGFPLRFNVEEGIFRIVGEGKWVIMEESHAK
jgi:hypothetical protein